MLVHAIAGLAAGIVARFFVPDSPGIGADTLAGILGGFLGGFVYELFGHKPPFYDYNGWSIVSAIAGAMILIFILRATAGRRTVA